MERSIAIMNEPIVFESLETADAAMAFGLKVLDYEFKCSLCHQNHVLGLATHHLILECYLNLWKILIRKVIVNCFYFSDPDDFRLLQMAIMNQPYSGDIEGSYIIEGCYINSGFYNRLSHAQWVELVSELAEITKPKYHWLAVHPLPIDQLWYRILTQLSPGTKAMMRLNKGDVDHGSPTVTA